MECEAVIVGAGPYGLSIAAHMRQLRADFRIFGVPMHNWRAAMPKGMFLKSEGAGSSIPDPDRAWTLAQYCAENNLAYGDDGVPISLETFTGYGLSYQRMFVPELEQTVVAAIGGSPGAYEVRLETGEMVRTRSVVVAVGTTYFAHYPPALAHLPRDLLSHSAEHHDLSAFRGRDVVVIGGGQSALETAALLHEQDGRASILVRAPGLAWNPPPSAAIPSPRQRLLHPASGLGAGWRPWFYCNGQELFQYLPRELRLAVVGRALGPAGAWWLKDRVIGRVPVMLGHVAETAGRGGDRLRLSIVRADGTRSTLSADHVIAATGFKVDVDALTFVDDGLRRRLRRVGTAPLLSHDFESSVPGLYFTGLAAANRFGPSMRFVIGAHYTARKIARALRPGRRFG